MTNPADLSLAARIYACAHLRGEFILSTGEKSTEYFETYRFQAEPALLREIAERLATLVPEGTEVITGPDLGGVPLATILSQVTGLPTAWVRKQAKDYGTRKLVEGAEVAGRRVVVVEPAIKTGRFVMGMCADLREHGAQITRVICVVDRQHGAPQRLAAAGLGWGALFTLAELVEASDGRS